MPCVRIRMYIRGMSAVLQGGECATRRLSCEYKIKKEIDHLFYLMRAGKLFWYRVQLRCKAAGRLFWYRKQA